MLSFRGASVDLAVRVFFSGVSDAGGGRFHFIFYFFFKVSMYFLKKIVNFL